MPHSKTFVADTIAAESIALPREVLPGVSLTNVSQQDGRVIYAFHGDQALDLRKDKAAMISTRCAVWKPALLRGEVKEIEHRYFADGQAQTYFIRSADCG